MDRFFLFLLLFFPFSVNRFQGKYQDVVPTVYKKRKEKQQKEKKAIQLKQQEAKQKTYKAKLEGAKPRKLTLETKRTLKKPASQLQLLGNRTERVFDIKKKKEKSSEMRRKELGLDFMKYISNNAYSPTAKGTSGFATSREKFAGRPQSQVDKRIERPEPSAEERERRQKLVSDQKIKCHQKQIKLKSQNEANKLQKYLQIEKVKEEQKQLIQKEIEEKRKRRKNRLKNRKKKPLDIQQLGKWLKNVKSLPRLDIDELIQPPEEKLELKISGSTKKEKSLDQDKFNVLSSKQQELAAFADRADDIRKQQALKKPEEDTEENAPQIISPEQKTNIKQIKNQIEEIKGKLQKINKKSLQEQPSKEEKQHSPQQNIAEEIKKEENVVIDVNEDTDTDQFQINRESELFSSTPEVQSKTVQKIDTEIQADDSPSYRQFQDDTRMKAIEDELRSIAIHLKSELSEKEKIIEAEIFNQKRKHQEYEELIKKQTQEIMDRVSSITQTLQEKHSSEIEKLVGKLMEHLDNLAERTAEIEKHNKKIEEEITSLHSSPDRNLESPIQITSDMRIALGSEAAVREQSQKLIEEVKIENLTDSVFDRNSFSEFTYKKYQEVLESNSENAVIVLREKNLKQQYSEEMKNLNSELEKGDISSTHHDTRLQELETWYTVERKALARAKQQQVVKALKTTANIIEQIEKDKERNQSLLNIQPKEETTELQIVDDSEMKRAVIQQRKKEAAKLLEEKKKAIEDGVKNRLLKAEEEETELLLKNAQELDVDEEINKRIQEMQKSKKAEQKDLPTPPIENKPFENTRYRSEELEKKLKIIKGEHIPEEITQSRHEQRIDQVNNITELILSELVGEVKKNLFPKRAEPFIIYPSPISIDSRISIGDETGKSSKKAKRPRGIQTGVWYVEEYINDVFRTILEDPEKFISCLSLPLNRDPLFILGQIQNEDNDYFESIEQIMTQPVLPVEFYLELERNRRIDTIEEQPEDSKHEAMLIEWSNIHNKCVFDSINDALDYYRPYGLKGPPLPWSKQLRELTYKNGAVDAIQDILLGVKSKVVMWAMSLAGTLQLPEELELAVIFAQLTTGNIPAEKSKLEQFVVHVWIE